MQTVDFFSCPAWQVSQDFFQPKDWSDLEVMTGTIFLEAESESYLGKLKIAQVIVNRSNNRKIPIKSVCLAPFQFSCWNEDYQVQAKRRFMNLPNGTVRDCWTASSLALTGAIIDEDKFTHYLNVDLTKKIRGGSLPKWASQAIEKGNGKKIGQHTFFKL
jgi:spore germination cell wall hydrolase CwlJ-like protein